MSKFILGISGSGTNSAAVLLKNGKLMMAIEEERISRIKHDGSIVPRGAIKKIIEANKINPEEISCIAIGWDYLRYRGKNSSIRKIYKRLVKRYPKKKLSKETLLSENKIIAKFQPEIIIKSLNDFFEELGVKKLPEVVFVRHHLSHAASTYYPSGFRKRTLIITMDGAGEGESTVVWIGEGKEIKEIERYEFPHSLGWVYSSITEFLGFKPHSQEGHVMGLSPYGKPKNKTERDLMKKVDQIFDQFLVVKKNGKYEVNPDLIWYGNHTYGNRFTDEWVEKLRPFVTPRNNEEKIKREHQILAYVLQHRLEKCILALIKRYLKKYPKINNLALAGGISLNCKTNGILIKLNPTKKIFFQPASNDAGTALGAALIVWRDRFGGDPRFNMKHSYYGTEYSNIEIENALKEFPFPYRLCSKKELLEEVTKMIIDNKPVAWFQGKMEWGPRALGNRSILINPADPKGNEKSNYIKGRDPWRPSAISLIEESAHKILEMGRVIKTPFMIAAFDVRKKYFSKISSGVHKADMTTRPQTVSKTSNPLFWQLLKNIEKENNIPCVLNTSFNKQEPIVESPKDALKNFSIMNGLDNLAIGNFIVKKG